MPTDETYYKKYLGYNYSQDRIKEFADALSVLPKALKGSINTPFVEFTINGTTFATYKNQDYFMQMSCTYAGVGNDPIVMSGGQGNQFSIQLVYMPKPNQDPNYVDELLAGVTADNKLCTLRFGYSGIPGYNLTSSTYDCIITGYSLTLQNNFLYYTIQCVSQGLIFREKRFTFYKGKDVNPIDWIYRCWSKSGVDKYYGLEIDQDIYGHVEEMDIGYNKDNEGNIIDNTNTLADVTVFQFLTTILENVKDRDDDNAVYWYELCDSTDKKVVMIHRTVIESDDNLEKLASFTFDWGGNHQDNSTNNLVLGFECDYKGEMNIAVSDKNFFEKKFGIDSTGNELYASGYNNYEYLVPDYLRVDYARNSKFWSRAVTWAYTAQLEILGVPADIPIGAYIEVNPLIYGRKHHTAGVYAIVGARCDISASGFRTNLSLMKLSVTENSSTAKFWDKVRENKQIMQTYYLDQFLNEQKNLYYVTSKGTLAVRNETTQTGLTFGGNDFVYVVNDPTSKGNTNYYNDYDSNIPASRGE